MALSVDEKMRHEQIDKAEKIDKVDALPEMAASYRVTSHTVAPHTVTTWAPPKAPLAMPRQTLEHSIKDRLRVKLASLLVLRQRT